MFQGNQMESVQFCIVCHQSFKMKDRLALFGVNLLSKRNQMRVCSPVCDRSLQYCLGLAHGFILFRVLQYLCGNISWKEDTASVLSVRKHRNSLCKKTTEDGYSGEIVKKEPHYVNHVEVDDTDIKVFFDPNECSDNEQDFTSSSAESLEKDHVSGLYTPPQVCDSSNIVSNCTPILLQQSTKVAQTKAKIQCLICHSKFSSGDHQALAEHLCRVHTKEIYLDIICDICGALFQNSELLKQHRKNVHCVRMSRDGSASIDKYKCDKCLQVFSTLDYFEQHHHSCQSVFTQALLIECSMCGKTFRKPDQLKRHMDCEHEADRKCVDGKRHQCHRCNKEYPSRFRLQRHNQFVHSPQAAVDCTVCGKPYRNKLLLKHHTQFMHSKQTPGICRVCGKTYRNTHLLKMHTKVVHKVKVVGDKVQESALQCIYCTHTFSTGTNDVIANHLAECHDKKVSPSCTVSCHTCGVEFRKKVHLTRHVKKVHGLGAVSGIKAERKNKRESDKKRYPCDKCGKTYTQSALSKHIRIYHTAHAPVNCDVCGKTLTNSFHLSQHKQRHVPTKICHICGANFKTDAGLRGHLAAHKGTKSHVCEVCGVGFVRKTSWQRHIKLHNENVRLQCDCCPKTFKTVYSLNTHMLSKHQRGVFFLNRLKTLEEVGYAIDKEAINRHLNCQCAVCSENLVSGMCAAHPANCTLSFKCNYCELVVSHVDDLCQHLKKHNIPLAFTASTRNFRASWSAKRDDTDVDYTCQVCHKSFQRRENLAGHMKQHREKAYECPVCLKRFTYKCNMKNHLRTHSQDKPFQCDLCPRAFKCRQLLNNHKLVHNPSQSPFKCQVCGKGLTRKFFLQRHYRQMHPGVTV